jgi:hypothetical protein
VIELVSKTGNPTPSQAPILQGVEIVRQRVVSLGFDAPDFLLNSRAPKQAGEIGLSNLRDRGFEGRIQAAPPTGIEFSLGRTRVELAAGGRATIPVEAAVGRDVSPGVYQVPVKLVRADGTVEAERVATVEHLGGRGRAVLRPVADAYVNQRYPNQNKGSATVLVVDGGDREMGDRAHSLAYLKFRLDVPGKPLSARLRIHNAGNPSGDSGRVCLVAEPWTENGVTYETRPEPGPELARLGRVSEHQVVECAIGIDLSGKKELSLIVDPTSCDGVDYLPREGAKPPELIVEYEPTD